MSPRKGQHHRKQLLRDAFSLVVYEAGSKGLTNTELIHKLSRFSTDFHDLRAACYRLRAILVLEGLLVAETSVVSGAHGGVKTCHMVWIGEPPVITEAARKMVSGIEPPAPSIEEPDDLPKKRVVEYVEPPVKVIRVDPAWLRWATQDQITQLMA